MFYGKAVRGACCLNPYMSMRKPKEMIFLSPIFGSNLIWNKNPDLVSC
jgi:hypothetical protein